MQAPGAAGAARLARGSAKHRKVCGDGTARCAAQLFICAIRVCMCICLLHVRRAQRCLADVTRLTVLFTEAELRMAMHDMLPAEL